MKNHISIRYNDQIAERIEQLKAWLNNTQTGIIELAINNLYNIERNKRMNLQILTEKVAEAIAKLEISGIEGWGLNNPNKELFEIVEVSGATGCISETCNHVSHDPAEATYRIIPKTGTIISMGYTTDSSETDYIWYALVSDDVTRFFEKRQPRHYHTSIREIKAENIPAWAYAQLAKN